MSSIRGLIADVIRSSYVDGPGHRYVVFVQGCTFNCVGCHNPHTITRRPTAESRWMTVDEVVADITQVAPFLAGITISGGEATTQWRFVLALFEAMAADPSLRHLTRLIDSNGDAPTFVWDSLAPLTDGVMVDLKAIDPEVHRELTGRDNSQVLASICHLAELEQLQEVRLLIVPDVNDSSEQLAATAQFLAGLKLRVPVVASGFRHHGTRPAAHRWREATADDIDAVVEALVAGGLDREQVSTRGVDRLGATVG